MSNISSVMTNNGSVKLNNGDVMTNNGSVKLNNGDVMTNNGSVKPDNGDVIINNGSVKPDNGDVITNIVIINIGSVIPIPSPPTDTSHLVVSHLQFTYPTTSHN